MLIAIGVFIQQYLDTKDLWKANDWLFFILSVFSVVGLIFSFLFYLSGKDGKRWELLINKELKKIEDIIFGRKETLSVKNIGLYTSILKEYKKPKVMKEYDIDLKLKEQFKDTYPVDIIDINIVTSKVFFAIWLLLIGIFLILFFF